MMPIEKAYIEKALSGTKANVKTAKPLTEREKLIGRIESYIKDILSMPDAAFTKMREETDYTIHLQLS